MTQARSRRAIVPAGFLPRLLLPFAIPILLTFALVMLAGDRWPRAIAPGSGLKLAGFCAAAFTAWLVWTRTVRGIADRRAHAFAALLCTATGLLGWPVWSVGILPSINGMALGPESTVTMSLERTETTAKSRSRERYHWAWLRAESRESTARSGRYFIPQAIYDDWRERSPATVEIRVARGLLGAEVVTGFD